MKNLLLAVSFLVSLTNGSAFAIATVDVPECVAIGSRSEGWQFQGKFVRYDQCAEKSFACVNQGSADEGFEVFKKTDEEFLGYDACASDESNKPKCVAEGSRSEGWLIKGATTYASCAGKILECVNKGSRSEGWAAYRKVDVSFLTKASCAITKTPVIENMAVKCETKGTFTTYKKGLFRTRVIKNTTADLCFRFIPPAKVNDDGSSFVSSCGYRSSKAGYSFEVTTHKIENVGVQVEIKLMESIITDKGILNKENEKTLSVPFILNQSRLSMSKEYAGLDILSEVQSKRVKTKLEKVNVSCELVKY